MFGKKEENPLKNLKPLGKVRNCRAEGDSLFISCDSGIAKINSPVSGVIRLRATCAADFESDCSYAVVEQEGPPPSIRISDENDAVRFEAECARILISKNPFRAQFQDADDVPFIVQTDAGDSGFRGDEPEWSMVAPAGEMYLGLGEKTGGLNKRGRSWKMRNRGIPYRTDTDPIYQSIPVLIGLKKGRAWAAFFDNTFESSFDLASQTPERWTWAAKGGEINIYFIAGPGLPDVVRRYMKLVGGIPMPPRWALGYHQSRYSYKTENEVRRIARTFRELKIPCDVIHLDIHYMRGYRVFTFDPNRFPDPKSLSEEMKELGIHLVCIADPGVKEDPEWDVWNDGVKKDVFCKSAKGGTVIKYCWPKRAGFPDFGREDVRKWWGDQHRVYVDAGIDGIWNDMNEPDNWNGAFYLGDLVVPLGIYDGVDMIHTHDGKPASHLRCRNVYGFTENRATREGLLRLRPDKRPFVITRSGYAGIGRYAIMWTGDNWSTWGHLKLTIPMLINLGLTGQPIAGPDTGGFMWNASGELFARWIQLGALYPFSRGHTMVYSRRHEPWSWGKRVADIARRYIGLRYQLLPYLYSLVWEAHRNGDPIWRPLSYHFPEDDIAAGIEDQVMVGPFLMAAPVLKRRAVKRDVYLPRGKWFEFSTGKIFEGPGRFEADAPLETMPLFNREGAIIPMGPIMQHTKEKPLDPLTLTIFPGNGNFNLWEDDGESMEYEQGEWARTPFAMSYTASALDVKIGPREGKFRVPDREIVARIRTDARPASISLNGQPLLPGKWEHENGFLQIEFHHAGEKILLTVMS